MSSGWTYRPPRWREANSAAPNLLAQSEGATSRCGKQSRKGQEGRKEEGKKRMKREGRDERLQNFRLPPRKAANTHRVGPPERGNAWWTRRRCGVRRRTSLNRSRSGECRCISPACIAASAHHTYTIVSRTVM